MHRNTRKRLSFLIVCVCLLAIVLCACGAVPENKNNKASGGTPLTADEAYETAMSVTEEEQCTDDECVVVLYDDDGECPYNVLSPLGGLSAA